MNKILIILLVTLIPLFYSFSLREVNDYYDFGLNEKTGTFGITPYIRPNYLLTGGTFSVKDGFTEWLLKYHTYIDLPELCGVFFNIDFTMANSAQLVDLFLKKNDRFLGEFKKLINFTFNYGEGYIGYKNTYVTLKFGFQNCKSTDSIYHNLLIDDYSGVYLGLRSDIMFSRFFDVQLIYNFIRPQNSLWTTKDLSSMTEAYNGLYGKSLFIKKLNFRPLPWIRIGLTDSVYFLGENFNIWYLNPFSLYYMTAAMSQVFKNKYGTEFNTGASDIKFTIDFNVGFDGWRAYGEVMIDDLDAKYVVFATGCSVIYPELK
ncbi:MAG TPA: hypothetical protein PK771_11485, partial [Spirochaetota bacterium]|nr:hypothetical protein [Spirochaetota bacterium]